MSFSWLAGNRYLPLCQKHNKLHSATQRKEIEPCSGKTNWIGLGQLCLNLSVLFTFAIDQHCVVASQRLNGTWEVALLDPLPPIAETQLQILMNELNNLQQPVDLLGDTRQRKATTRDWYKLFSDRGQVWAPYEL
jgi:hypothetical protein